MNKILSIISIIWISFSVSAQENLTSGNEDLLKLKEIKPNVYVHETYLQTETWGKVGCNGLIYIVRKEAIVFDTPTDSISTEELFKSFEKAGIAVKAIVINHFHNDCLGGLKEFHKRNIESYASFKTIEFTKRDGIEIPKNGFENKSKIKIGNKTIINYQPGAAHTQDNIVSYVPSQKVLFGGCMVKEVDAGKGWLGDADTIAWPNTIRKVKSKFKKAQIIVPGHGKTGGRELLDFTETLFSVK